MEVGNPKGSAALIELQGELKSVTDTPLEDQYIGDLHFTTNGTPVLIIGHHLLYGKEVLLEKPLAYMEKKNSNDSTEYIVKTIITKKIIFKTRPKPVV